MLKKKLLFIANPISGNQAPVDLAGLISSTLDKKRFDWELYYTTGRGDATRRAKQAVDEGADAVIAVGGDGTINEIAQAMVHSGVPMGIIPNGSGNGLAFHMGMSGHIPEALAQLNLAKETPIDTGLFNDRLFLNVAGLGFDAQVAHAFDSHGKRGLGSYIKLSVWEFLRFSPPICQIQMDGEEKTRKAFIITVANGSQYGNNAYIAPKASLNDGWLDVAIISPLKPWQLFSFPFKLFTRQLHNGSSYELSRAKKIHIRTTLTKAQIDGEAIAAKSENVIEIQPQSLMVLVPDV